jgi:hypothetical protein
VDSVLLAAAGVRGGVERSFGDLITLHAAIEARAC